MNKKICVFCGAQEKVNAKFKKIAEDCGRMIGEAGYTLVYGGSTRGMMGVLAQSASKYGGHVIGAFPENLLCVQEVLNKDLDETIIVDSMHERKREMIERADAFITLPGGFGTLDEFFEVLTLKNIAVSDRPLFLLNVDGYWDALISLINSVFDNGFALNENRAHCEIFENLDELFAQIKRNV